MSRYNPKEAEPKWRRRWAEADVFRTSNDRNKPKYFVLEMFPYPSGRIHIGHVRNYAMGDVVARYRSARSAIRASPDGLGRVRTSGRERGDANRQHSARLAANIEAMKEQLQSMGLSLDWARTRDVRSFLLPLEQKLFLDFWRAGFAERRESYVNWDPVHMTVLADEQVIDGKGWRSGAPVERRKLSQWF